MGLRGRLSDVHDALDLIVDRLSGQLRRDVARELATSGMDLMRYASEAPDRSALLLGNDDEEAPMMTRSVTMPSPKAAQKIQSAAPSLRRRADWAECVERLRIRACSGDGSDLLYEDIRSVFEALGLGELPPRENGGMSPTAAYASRPGPLPPPPARTGGAAQPSHIAPLPSTPVVDDLPAESLGNGIAHPKPAQKVKTDNVLPGQIRPQTAGSEASEESV